MAIYEKNVDYPGGVKPFTRQVIPAANIIVVAGKWLGYIQNIDETQDRPVTEQYEVGSVGVVEIIPGQPKYSLTLSKAKVYTARATQIFMDLSYSEIYGETTVKDAITGQMVGDAKNKALEVFSLIQHNILPFNIEIWELNYGVDQEGKPMDFNLDQASKSKIKTKYVDCWISNSTTPVSQGNVNVIETINLSCRKITMSA